MTAHGTWNPAERALVDHLRQLGHVVEPVPRSAVGRSADAVVDGVPTEFKTPLPGATSATMRNRANESKRRGGQARFLVFDVRGEGMTVEEAERGITRIMGAYSKYFDGVRVVGDDFDLDRKW